MGMRNGQIGSHDEHLSVITDFLCGERYALMPYSLLLILCGKKHPHCCAYYYRNAIANVVVYPLPLCMDTIKPSDQTSIRDGYSKFSSPSKQAVTIAKKGASQSCVASLCTWISQIETGA